MTSIHPEVERLAAGSYVALTTFKKDGTAVATPVWLSSDDVKLFVWTQADAGKVKRIRNSPRVTLAPCDARGRVQGVAVDAVARIMDAGETEVVESLHKKKYGIQFRFFSTLGAILRRSKQGQVGIELSLPTPAAAPERN